jgi:hypothetical protein
MMKENIPICHHGVDAILGYIGDNSPLWEIGHLGQLFVVGARHLDQTAI